MKMEQEQEAWKKANYHYKTFFKEEQRRVDKRKSDLSQRKAKAKEKASDVEENWNCLHRFYLATSVLGLRHTISGSLERESTRTRIGHEEVEARLKKQYSKLPYSLDTLHTHVNAAREMTRTVEAELDSRFRLLTLVLDARSGDLHDTSRSGTASAATQIVNSHITPAPYAPTHRANDPHDLFRALARVDSMRPPRQMGDGARRAAKEVHRMEENGIAGSSQRTLTEVPPTPKKAPGTPRRGNKPRKGGTPGR
ncbi:hypothetical protein D9757_010771 [Collybiopsis confluens]|uniref:Uncharacterized protein n=1 Tax=Collybiopsis confluens TaxID=2823264 RepID=A0A8H5H936_9AGAR|nr:hypothetical protein D9757_010771 [Collybiopsis confluens]